MSQNDMFQGEMDPEIAALLGTSTVSNQSSQKDVPPDYAKLFLDEEIEEAESLEIDLTEKTFPPITKRFSDVPITVFNDPNYYKSVLAGEGDIVQRVHTVLQKYMNSKDPKDRSVFRQQFITAFWEFLLNVARKAPGRIAPPKKNLLRFGILHPSFIDAGDREFFAKIIVENDLNQPIYYLDEWIKGVGTGAIRNSSTDEVRISKSNSQTKLMQLLEKAAGKRDGAKNLLKAKSEERLHLESVLQEKVAFISEHYPIEGMSGVYSNYTEYQKKGFSEIQEILKTMIKSDRELESFIQDFHQAETDVRTIEQKIDEEGVVVEVDMRAVDTEFETVRQMTKMTIGRQGNHFPILTKEYFRCSPNDIAYRENVISILTWLESIDPEAFCRSYKNRLNRIVPYVVLLPSYGDSGICWEPFDRFNRATSRGRVAIPMYSKNLNLAILSAVADLRWQVAKEKASYYWMEEGITGHYYQWFTSRKLKGDVKEFFIEDYITWITKESEGTQKLDKEVRGMFWRYLPFSQAVKEKLKGRSYVYQELYQRDVNRTMSDGY
jgi:hypothetical protein